MSKIEDALEKAKKARSGEGPKFPISELKKSSIGSESRPSGETTPNYTRSAFMEVDPQLMETNRLVTLTGEASYTTEQYRMLRTQVLQKTEGNGNNCLMVTSTIDGEGKTTTAINLAVAIAKEVQKTVLLVDADLRRPSVHTMLGLNPGKGLVQYLQDDVPLEDLLIRTGVEKLTLLPAGGTLPDSTEILGSSKMQNLIREVKERYKDRYVIFDTTPLLSTADPSVLAQFMDGIIFVVQAERTPRSEMDQALNLLEGRNILGIVMNSLSETTSRYDYD